MSGNDVWEWFKEFLKVGGPSTVVAWGAFQVFGKKWLDAKFAERLEELKHAKNTELEYIRHEIQAAHSRITKIHEKEFEVLPKAWFMLHDAYGAAFNVVARFRTAPDFRSLSEPEFEEFLATQSRLSPTQQKKLRTASDRKRYFYEAIAAVDFDTAIEKRRLLNNYIIAERIFMTKDLHERFRAASDAIFMGLNDFDIGKTAHDQKIYHEGSTKITSLDASVAEISKLIQDRLHYKDDMI